MKFRQFQHTRSTGLKLTYDIKILSNRYTISLDGVVLKDAVRPTVLGGNVSDEEATMVFAINDIEQLVGLHEQ